MSIRSFLSSFDLSYAIQEQIRAWCFPAMEKEDLDERFLPEAAAAVVDYLKEHLQPKITQAMISDDSVEAASKALVDYMENRNPQPLTYEQLRTRQIRIVLRAAVDHAFQGEQ